MKTAIDIIVKGDGLYTTRCHKCVFAKFEPKNPHHGDTNDIQIGCELGRTDKYQDKEYITINDKEAFELNRICNAQRDIESDWPEIHDGENLKELVLKEVELQVDVVVPINFYHTETQLAFTLESLRNSKIPPRHIHLIFLCQSAHMSHTDVIQLCKQIKFPDEITWHVTRFLERKPKSIDYSLEYIKEQLRGQYYIICPCERIMPANYLSFLNQKLNYDMDRFLVLTGDQDRFLETVSIPSFKNSILVGNTSVTFTHEETGEVITCTDIIDKIKFIAKEDGKEYLIKTVADYYEV